MPKTRSAAKHLRQTKRLTAHNTAVKTRLRFLLKRTRRAIEAKKSSEAAALCAQVIKAYDKAAEHGVIKHNTASRTISRLIRRLNAVNAPAS